MSVNYVNVMACALMMVLGLAHAHSAEGEAPKTCYLPTRPTHQFSDHVAVANRGSGSVSIINPATLKVVANYTIAAPSEPMYLGLSPDKSELWVGDRARSGLVILEMKGNSLSEIGFLPTPQGLFHSMTTQERVPYRLTWTTTDVANVVVVHDVTTRRQLATIERPDIVTEQGGFPHDVTTNAKYAFVTYIGNANGKGYVASYDTTTFNMLAILETLKDPHVAVRGDSQLGIAAQGGEVLLVSTPDLRVLARKREPSPHGISLSFDRHRLYVANIAEDGRRALVTFRMRNLARFSCPFVRSLRPVPHNIKTSSDDTKIFVTHSGATAFTVSVFNIDKNGCPKPRSERLIETGLNPFGLCVIPPAPRVPLCESRFDPCKGPSRWCR